MDFNENKDKIEKHIEIDRHSDKTYTKYEDRNFLNLFEEVTDDREFEKNFLSNLIEGQRMMTNCNDNEIKIEKVNDNEIQINVPSNLIDAPTTMLIEVENPDNKISFEKVQTSTPSLKQKKRIKNKNRKRSLIFTRNNIVKRVPNIESDSESQYSFRNYMMPSDLHFNRDMRDEILKMIHFEIRDMFTESNLKRVKGSTNLFMENPKQSYIDYKLLTFQTYLIIFILFISRFEHLL